MLDLARNVADLADPPPAIKTEGGVWDEVELDRFLIATALNNFKC